MGQKNALRKGFTLIELSIVLVIVGIMLYGGLSLGAIQIEAAKLKATRDKMDKIDRAILVYYQTNGMLPCPAKGNLARNDSNFGVGLASSRARNTSLSDVTCTVVSGSYSPTSALNSVFDWRGTNYVGVVPVRTLDLPDDFITDAWDNRITYVVSKHCVDPDNWDKNQPFKCVSIINETTSSKDYNYVTYGIPFTSPSVEPGGNIEIDDTATPSTHLRTSLAAYAVISHGKNSYGAWTADGGGRIAAPSGGTNNIEGANAHVDTSGNVSGTYGVFTDGDVTDYTGAGTNYFDDIVHWKTPPQIYYDATHPF